MRTWRKRHQRESYERIEIDSLLVDTCPPFDLFIKTNGKLAAFLRAGATLDSQQRQALESPQIEGVYLAASSQPKYQEYMEQSLEQQLNSGMIPLRRKVELLCQTATGLIDTIFAEQPGASHIERAALVSGQIVSLILADDAAIGEFLTIIAGEYSAPAHSTNVCFLSVALAQRVGVGDRRNLEDLALGALLHDIGQTRISRQILGKRGPLTTAEYDLIKKAPWWGVDILAQSSIVRKDAFLPVLQHQERLDGTGYPVGLRGNDVHLYGRICGLVEAYDAITSKHVYKDALDSFPALVTMMGDTDKFDTNLMQAFIRLLKRQKEPEESGSPAHATRLI